MSRSPVRPLALALAILAATAIAPRAHAAAAVALPDTGLFAPVADQYRARLGVLEGVAGQPLDAEQVMLLLATGQPDRADTLLRRVARPSRALQVAGARVALARQDFAPVEALLATLASRGALLPRERSLRLALAFAKDDAATIDSIAQARIGRVPDADAIPELLAAGRVAYDRLDYPRADTLFTHALAACPPQPLRSAWGDSTSARRALALTGLALVQQKQRQWDASLATLRAALDEDGSADVLMALTETLIRLGRTDEAISAAEWAVKLAPYHDAAHYLLGNGYARKNYTQLAAAYPRAFADAAGRALLAKADAKLAAGDRAGARAAYARVIALHPGWADARVRLASLDFEDGRFAESRAGGFAALRACPEYGRAHAVIAKALEGQRFVVDVHRAAYEARFAAAPMPDVPGIEQFVTNWRSLSPRHQKRVALSIAPWKRFVPVLIEGGATYYIKPVYMLLSECPAQRTLRDQRINYDSRLWDDVRGCGGYHTVTGIEDVERTIFDRYNTVLHELTHQVHGILPADDMRRIQEHYRQAKERDDATRDGYLSRYAGGSVWEYFAEGANALASPMRDAYDPRDVVRERLDRIDPALRALVEGFQMRRDVSGCYPVAYANGGDDLLTQGKVDPAIPLYRKALEIAPANETALLSLGNALLLAGRAAEAESVAARAAAAHPASGAVRVLQADAAWHTGRGLAAARASLASARALVRESDRYRVDGALGAYALLAGDGAAALAAYDSVLAYQSDSPEGLPGRAAALAQLAADGKGDWNAAFTQYDAAVRMRTGIVSLRASYALDLLRAGRVAEARVQLDAAKLLDERHPDVEALRGWAALASGDVKAARAHAEQALAWGAWSDLARIVQAGALRAGGDARAAAAAWEAFDARLAKETRPGYVFRKELSSWQLVHAHGAAEAAVAAALRGR